LSIFPKKEFQTQLIRQTKSPFKVPSLQISTNIIKTNDGDELSGKLFADESLKNGEC